jgi:hypothetical protein
MSIWLTILIAGCLGGIASYFLRFMPVESESVPISISFSDIRSNALELIARLVVGIAAAYTVPVLLHATSSNLIEQVERQYHAQGQPGVSTPQPVTPQPVTPQPVTSQPVTPQPVTPQPVTPQPVTPQPVTPQPVTPQPVTPQPVTPQPVTPQPVTPQPVTPQSVTPQSVTPQTVSERNTSASWFVLFGFCVLASYASQRFLGTMLNRVLEKVEEVKAQVKKVEAKTEKVEAKVAKAEVNAEAALQIAEQVDDEFSEPDEVVQTGMQAESASAVVLNPDQIKVMKAFEKARRTKSWIRRSLDGLVKDTELSSVKVTDALTTLVSLGMVTKRAGRGRAGWSLSSDGWRWIEAKMSRGEEAPLAHS